MLVLTIEAPGQPPWTHRFASGTLCIGRQPSCDLQLACAHISSRHAQIRHEGGRYLLCDLGSTNGSVVMRGAERLLLGPRGHAELALRDGDLLLLGDIDQAVRLRVSLEARAGSAVSETIVATRARVQAPALTQELTADHQALSVIYQLVQALSGLNRREDLLEQVASAALRAVPGAVDALVAVLPEAPGAEPRLVAEAHHGPGVSRSPDRGLCRQVIDEGRALLFGRHDEARVPARTLVAQGIGTGIVAPLWQAEQVIGVLQVNCEPDRLELTTRHLDLCVVMAHHAAAALERAELIARLQEAERRQRDENTLLRRRTQPRVQMVAESPAMRAIVAELTRAAHSDVTVLLSGETGTGKEVAARFIHERSPRRDGLLVPVNCGALSETLLDSELFGHRKGAFTGASGDRKGVFEVARGGTVFLDEVGEMPASVQVRLLRVLEEGKIKMIGEAVERGVDARIIAATNRDLSAMVEQGRFRRDLYYRLRVFPVTLPPLRQRPEDLLPLLRLFVDRFARELGQGATEVSIDPGVPIILNHYSFPGNVRELCNEVERAMVRREPGQPLSVELFSEELQQPHAPLPRPAGGTTLKERLDEVERCIIVETLARHDGRRAAAAHELGLTRQGLGKKMERLGITGSGIS